MVKNIFNYWNFLVSVKVKDIVFFILNYKVFLFVVIYIFYCIKKFDFVI